MDSATQLVCCRVLKWYDFQNHTNNNRVSCTDVLNLLRNPSLVVASKISTLTSAVFGGQSLFLPIRHLDNMMNREEGRPNGPTDQGK